MPATVQESLKSRSVEAVPDAEGRLKGLRVHTYFVAETQESWESKRNFIAERAVGEKAAELSFGGRVLFGMAETYQQIKMKRLLDAKSRGRAVKPKGAAEQRASDTLDELFGSVDETGDGSKYAEELEALAGFKSIRGNSKRDRLSALWEGLDVRGEYSPAARVKSLIADYACGNLDDVEELRIQAEDISKELAATMSKRFGGRKVGTDLVSVCLEARKVYLDHQERLANLDVDLTMITGQADGGLQTKGKRDLVDWLVDLSMKVPGVNCLTVGVAAGVGAFALKVPVRAVPLIGGLAGGAFAFLRRFSKEGQDRSLAQRQEEIGYEISAPSESKDKLEKLAVKALGRTDFSRYSYNLQPAVELTEKLADYINHGDRPGLISYESSQGAREYMAETRSKMVEMVAEVDARLSVAEEKGRATLVFGHEGSGLFNINQERFELVATAAAARTKLLAIMRQEEFEEQYSDFYSEIKRSLEAGIKKQDARFRLNQLKQSSRSFGFAGAVGVAGGLLFWLSGEAVEGASEATANLVFDEREKVTTSVIGDVTIADNGTNIGITLPYGYDAQISSDGQEMIFKSPEGREFEVPYVARMSADEIRQKMEEAGFGANVTLATEKISEPAHTVAQEILSGDYLREHNLAEVTGKNYQLVFGSGRDLTLHQADAHHWFVSNLSGVREDSLVAFYQLRDGAGKLHTVFADTTNGRFTIPDEFVNPQTGKVDGLTALGYGRVYDAAGRIVAAEQAIANPDVISGGKLESLASVAFDQKERIIPGVETTINRINIEDLTKLDIDTENYDYDTYFPPVATPFAPRVFPAVYGMPSSYSSRGEQADGGGNKGFVTTIYRQPSLFGESLLERGREEEEEIRQIQEDLARIAAQSQTAVVEGQYRVVEEEEDEEETFPKKTGLKTFRFRNLSRIAQKTARWREQETGTRQVVAHPYKGLGFSGRLSTLFKRETVEETAEYLKSRGLQPRVVDARWFWVGPRMKARPVAKDEDEEEKRIRRLNEILAKRDVSQR